MKRIWIPGAILAALLLTLTGCFFRSPEDLYQSPERSADYLSLTQTIASVKKSLALEYGSEPEDVSVLNGDNTALIQLQDLDGDGERETAVTFFRVPEAEKPLQIYFFTRTAEDSYSVSAVVEGNGSAISRVDYADLNGNGYKEVVVSWQMNTGAYLLGIYSLQEAMTRNVTYAAPSADSGTASVLPGSTTLLNRDALRATEWLTTAYSAYALYDLDQDTRTEVAVVRTDNTAVDLYAWRDGTFQVRDTAPLSAGITSLESTNAILTDFVKGTGDVPIRALYLSSILTDEQRAVDVIAYQDGTLTNLSLDENGVSREKLDRYLDLDPTDVNGDGILELPVPVALPYEGDTSASDFWLIDWSQYTGSGEKIPICTTYHNLTDGWYLTVPEDWKGQIILRRRDAIGQRSVVFYHLEGEGKEPTAFLAIHKFTSQFDRAETSNRFLLREEENAVYAATFYDVAWDYGMTETDLQSAFHLIQSSWSD